MKKNGKSPPAKSREWLEVECLKIARRTSGGSEIERVTIRRLHPTNRGINWKVADLIPQPSLRASGKVRARLARLTGKYALENEAN